MQPSNFLLDYQSSMYQSSSMSRENKPLPAAPLYLVLALLEGEQHGYALMRRVAELSDGAWQMGPGTLYGTLNKLVADGLIEETRVDRDESERRRYYTLTGTGREVATTELARLRSLVRRVGRNLPAT
jgi:DNA-binding PadR family transcriptional regulator